MKISNSFLASLGVAGLIVFLIFVDFNKKNKTAIAEKKAAREQLVRNHHSEWDLTSAVQFDGGTEFIDWIEILRVPLGTIPIDPSYLPPQAKDSMRQTVERVVTSEVQRLSPLGSEASEHQLFGQFVVTSGAARNAKTILSQPVFGGSPESGGEVTDEFLRRLESHTDFAFADFLLTCESEEQIVVDKLAFRLWYDYASREWRLLKESPAATSRDLIAHVDWR